MRSEARRAQALQQARDHLQMPSETARIMVPAVDQPGEKPPLSANERRLAEQDYFRRLRQLREDQKVVRESIAALKDDITGDGLDPAMIDLAVRKAMEDDERRRARLDREADARQLLLDLGLDDAAALTAAELSEPEEDAA